QIRRGSEIRFGVRLEDRNAHGVEQVAHGRISGGVRTGDAMALQLKQAGERRHRRAADAAEMNVAWRNAHGATAGSSRRNCGSLLRSSSDFIPKVRVTFWRETWP